jgi:peptidoglycan-N-acetylglucosamine deacetylase
MRRSPLVGRRRRRLETALAVLAVAFAASAAAIAVFPAAASSPQAVGVDGRAVRHRRAADRGGGRLRFGRDPRLAAQLRAARRLAAAGLPMYCGGDRGRMVALTFDDGPGPYTRLVIKKLRRAHVHATFFLVGKQIAAFPKLARLEKPIAAVGDHTMTHPFLPALARAQMIAEITKARSVIERAAGQPLALFRPPYGGHTPAIDRAAKRLRLVEVLWNVDSADSLGANYLGIERNVIAGLHPGSIILMHENRGQTIRALPRIFAALRRRRLRAVTVPELIAADPPSAGQLRRGWSGCDIRHRAGNGS